MSYTTMPFGKHKGELIENLPTPYLAYALSEFDLPKELDFELFKQLNTRVDKWGFMNEHTIHKKTLSKKIDDAIQCTNNKFGKIALEEFKKSVL